MVMGGSGANELNKSWCFMKCSSINAIILFDNCLCYFYRLVKTVPSVVSVGAKCQHISVLSASISPVLTKIHIIAKNVEFAGRWLPIICCYSGKIMTVVINKRCSRQTLQ